ncbi:MAG: SDR family oxidoreductase [Cyanobacteria bacterium P01_G01_bin.54]
MNKSALITGGSDRIGREIAICFAEMGFDIVLHYNSAKAKAEETKQIITNQGRNCSIYQANFGNEAAVKKLITEVCLNHNLSVLVNNASIFIESALSDENNDIFEQSYQIHFKASYLLTKHFSRIKETGQIINILDAGIHQNSTEYFDYLLSKKFLYDFTMMSAFHLAPNFRVNAIAPGKILPPQGKGVDYMNKLVTGIPLKKAGSIPDIKAATKYLVENEFITGQVMFVDGGDHLK